MRHCINNMPVFKYEIHRTINKVTGPMLVEADTWLEARVIVANSLKNNYAFKNFEIVRLENKEKSK